MFLSRTVHSLNLPPTFSTASHCLPLHAANMPLTYRHHSAYYSVFPGAPTLPTIFGPLPP